MSEPECPCADCDTRRTYALLFDIHIVGEDCPYLCDKYEKYKAERKEQNDESN